MIPLPEDDASVFNLYVILTYTGSVATKGVALWHDPEEWKTQTRLYVLAEKLQDVWAKNRILDAMRHCLNPTINYGEAEAEADAARAWFECRSTLDSLNELYEGTPPSSPARRLIVDHYAGRIETKTLRAGKDTFPEDFIFDMAVRLMAQLPASSARGIWLQPSSRYRETPKVTANAFGTAGDKKDAVIRGSQ